MRRRNIDRYSADSLSHDRLTIDRLFTDYRSTIDRRPSNAISTDKSVDTTYSKQHLIFKERKINATYKQKRKLFKEQGLIYLKLIEIQEADIESNILLTVPC